jgi:hypothetical protein
MFKRGFTNFYCADIILDVSFLAHDSARVAMIASPCFAFQVKAKEAGAELVKKFLIIIFAHRKPLRRKCASQRALVNRRTFPGILARRRFLVVTGRALAAQRRFGY